MSGAWAIKKEESDEEETRGRSSSTGWASTNPPHEQPVSFESHAFDDALDPRMSDQAFLPTDLTSPVRRRGTEDKNPKARAPPIKQEENDESQAPLDDPEEDALDKISKHVSISDSEPIPLEATLGSLTLPPDLHRQVRPTSFTETGENFIFSLSPLMPHRDPPDQEYSPFGPPTTMRSYDNYYHYNYPQGHMPMTYPTRPRDMMDDLQPPQETIYMEAEQGRPPATSSGEASSQFHRGPSQKELDDAKNPRARTALRTWYNRLEDLSRYRSEHGHCNVPQKFPQKKELGIWVNKQRMEKKNWDMGMKCSLTLDKMRALEQVGFQWAKPKGQASWDAKYAELRRYEHLHGNCQVPTKYPKNPALGRWVSTQRSQYKMYKAGEPSSMTPQKIETLDRLGFVWQMMQN